MGAITDRGPNRSPRLVAAAVSLLLLLVGCGVDGGAGDTSAKTTTTSNGASAGKAPKPGGTTTTEMEGKGDPIDDPDPNAVPTSMVTISDPVNDAFTVDVPEGWDNLAYSNVEGQTVRQVVNSISPDGSTVLFVGDPKIPGYWNPDTANPITVQMADMLESVELRSYEPAEDYVASYVTEKFGELDGFTLGDVQRLTDREQDYIDYAAGKGVTFMDVRIAQVRFTFNDEAGKANEASVTAETLNSGDFWYADVNGAATTGDVDTYVDVARRIADSRKQKESFTAMLNQRHQDTMAMIQQRTEEMTRQHEANMAWIQDSANAHQARMQAIWDSNDAQISGWYDRMASQDVEHRQFLNYINEERTVLTSTGEKRQVDDGYPRYWMNPATGTYYGGDINFDENALRQMGIDPSSFEEVKIVKG